MFKSFTLSLAATVVACAMLGSPAQALVLNGPCSVLAHWEFEQPPSGPVSPTDLQTTPCPPATGFHSAQALLDPNPNTNGQVGTHWQITLPNFIDELNTKKIWIHVETPTPADDFELSVIAFDNDPQMQNPIPGILHEIIQLNPTAPTGFLAHFWLRPNPDWEIIDIATRIDMPQITNIWVHTISMDIPEPATLALFGLGLAGLGFARRRKTV